MDTMRDNRGCLPAVAGRVGAGIGLLAVAVLVVVLLTGGGAEDDPTTGGPLANDPATGADVPAAVTLPDGSSITIEVFGSGTAGTTIVAAPSRNADITSLRPVGQLLADTRCADLVAFDAATVSADPIAVYRAVLDAVAAGAFGPVPDQIGTLGASFTALPAWQAAREIDAAYAFSFSPSDPFPGSAPNDGPTTFLFVAEGDTGFLDRFEQWKAAGFNGVTVPGDAHGSALFTGPDDQVILNRIERALCF